MRGFKLVDISWRQLKPRSPRLSTYLLVSSSSDHSIRASISDTKFPHVLWSRRRRRPRSSSTSNGNDISLSSTHHTDEDRNLRPFRTPLDSSPELLQPQPILPLRVRLTRLSDPVPILQDSHVFHVQVRDKTDRFLLFILAANPNTLVSARFYIERRAVQITTKTI